MIQKSLINTFPQDIYSIGMMSLYNLDEKWMISDWWLEKQIGSRWEMIQLIIMIYKLGYDVSNDVANHHVYNDSAIVVGPSTVTYRHNNSGNVPLAGATLGHFNYKLAFLGPETHHWVFFVLVTDKIQLKSKVFEYIPWSFCIYLLKFCICLPTFCIYLLKFTKMISPQH